MRWTQCGSTAAEYHQKVMRKGVGPQWLEWVAGKKSRSPLPPSIKPKIGEQDREIRILGVEPGAHSRRLAALGSWAALFQLWVLCHKAPTLSSFRCLI